MTRKPYFPRQELAARGLGPMAIAALERPYQITEEQAEEITKLDERMKAAEEELGDRFDFNRPGPTYADIAALQGQIDDLKVLARPPAAEPEPAQDLMYPPSYS